MQFFRMLIGGLCFALMSTAAAQGAAEDPQESRDDGVSAVAQLRLENVSSPTPLEIPGAQRILTGTLLRRMSVADRSTVPLLFDVLGGNGHESLPGAIWLPGAGRGRSFNDEVQAQLARVLQQTTSGNFSRPVVFFCASSQCWLSYNTALRAARLGYTEVYWYRGGIEAWLAAGQSLVPMRVSWKRPEE